MSKDDFRLDIATSRRRHDDAQKYVVYVLWLIGLSERTIAHAMGMRKQQVSGLINRSEYRGRASMMDQERRKLLQELREIRMEDGKPIDGGKLNKIEWEIRPLTEPQLRGPLRRKMR